MEKNFDIFGQIAKELESFKRDKIRIAGNETNDDARYLKKETRGYFFNQWETVNLIDLYYNSKFETGQIDSEGQRKLFLNICAFRADVASKMIDLDTKDFVWIPDDESSNWISYFVTKEFRDWARENYFGELINTFVELYPKYGSVVSKKVGKEMQNVPLQDIAIQTDAESIKQASFFTHIHPKMTLDEMEEFPDWDTVGLEMSYGETKDVYERYGTVPRTWYEKTTGKLGTGSSKLVNVVVICVLVEKKKKNNSEYTGTILFVEECKKEDRPFREAHWKRQKGRWLGIGEIENLFENQISRNMIVNLRRRALLWSSKKVFQSADDTVAKNLIRDVKDGDVMKIMPNGNITQIDMASREVGEFQSAEQVWEENSNQKSFTYDAATGETPPSGTPFRLQVLVSNAIASHFDQKKEKLGIFFKKMIIEDVYEIFKKENSKAHTVAIFGTEEGMNNLKKVASVVELNKRIFNWAMSDDTEIPDFEMWKQIIEEGYQEKPHLFIEMPDDIFDEAKHHVELTLTGEEIDTKAELETLTNIYQSMVQSGDPRSEQVLSRIMSLTGKNLEAMLGKKPEPKPVENKTEQGTGQDATTPSILQGMNKQTV